ncbi:hypothetical protein WJX72_011011 [[Myrmecia] bisecta]|uniref:Fanconi Anaemia group E protein C-terminal domain-containing protein n=1 Tax=[Myrmecia] bisecta TaxID=41462 RepID=A0AAW1R934_9CHLO
MPDIELSRTTGRSGPSTPQIACTKQMPELLGDPPSWLLGSVCCALSVDLHPGPNHSGLSGNHPTSDLKALALRLQESLINVQAIESSGQLPTATVAGFETLLSEPDSEALAQLRLEELPDIITQLLCTQLLPSSAGRSVCVTLLGAALLQKCLRLSTPPSRSLQTAITHCVREHPGPMLEAVLVPLLQRQQMLRPQCDVIMHSIKSGMPGQLLPGLVAALSSNVSIAWTENTLDVLQAIVTAHPPLPQGLMEGLATSLEAFAGQFAASVRFIKLINCLCATYGDQALQHRTCLLHAVAQNRTFMAKSAAKRLRS